MVDYSCHGVPSPKVYRKHLTEIEKTAGEPITCVKFRDKSNGWKQGETLFFTEHYRIGAPKRQEPFMRLFLNNLIIRPSCSDCAFNNKRSLADITIADYWGIDNAAPGFNDNKGVSLVLVNTEKGKIAFEKIKENIDWIETRIEDSMQPPLKEPFPRPKEREQFWKDFEEKNFSHIARKYGGLIPFWRKIVRKIKQIIRKLMIK